MKGGRKTRSSPVEPLSCDEAVMEYRIIYVPGLGYLGSGVRLTPRNLGMQGYLGTQA